MKIFKLKKNSAFIFKKQETICFLEKYDHIIFHFLRQIKNLYNLKQ